MRKPVVVAALAVCFAFTAWAIDRRVARHTGVGVQRTQLTEKTPYMVQCPYGGAFVLVGDDTGTATANDGGAVALNGIFVPTYQPYDFETTRDDVYVATIHADAGASQDCRVFLRTSPKLP